MKYSFKTRTGGQAQTSEVETVKDLFRAIADLQEILCVEHECGLCSCPNINFTVREIDENEYYKLVCQNPDCGAQFDFGQTKKGGRLFPKRNDKDNKPMANRGWHIWRSQPQSQQVRSIGR